MPLALNTTMPRVAVQSSLSEYTVPFVTASQQHNVYLNGINYSVISTGTEVAEFRRNRKEPSRRRPFGGVALPWFKIGNMFDGPQSIIF